MVDYLEPVQDIAFVAKFSDLCRNEDIEQALTYLIEYSDTLYFFTYNNMENTTIQLTPVDIKERKELDIRAGDTARVRLKIKEKDKTRIQVFEGVVLAVKHGKESGGTFTVRKVMSGVGVEKIFPIYSPSIDKVEIIKRSKVRRAKLYYIREKVAREIRRKMRKMMNVPVVVKKEEPVEEKPEVEVKEGEEIKTETSVEENIENTKEKEKSEETKEEKPEEPKKEV